MNKKAIITILLALIAMAGQAQVHYRLEGNIGNSDISDRMEVRDNFNNVLIDSIHVVNGKIEPIEGTIPDYAICYLWGDSRPPIYPIFLGGGTTRIENVSSIHPLLSGTPLCEDYTKFQSAVQQANGELMMRKLRSGQTKFTVKLDAEASQQIADVAKDIITRHDSDVLGYYLLREGAINYIQPTEWLSLAERMVPWLKKNPKLFDDYSKNCKPLQEAASSTSVGCKFVDVEADVDGKTFKLSDYVGRGNYVVMNFWGTTCPPCITELPVLKQIHQQYASHGLTVLGIPVNEDAEKSRQAIDKYQLSYPQLLNTQDKAAKAYGFVTIPETILFAPDGTILARGLSMDELKAKLEEIFPDNK